MAVARQRIADRGDVEAPAGGLDERERAIAQSVLYAGLFDYPLTLAQLRATLMACRLTPSEVLAVYRRSEALRAIVGAQDGWFFPAGRASLIAERRRRERRSRAFLHHHRLFLAALRCLPWIRLAALSGSVAHLNLEGSGDLDLLLVTRRGRVWVVTVAAIVLAKLLRRRSTACINFVVDEAHVGFEPQDLFSASQIVHLKPLTGWPEYERLLALNPFVAACYPNFHPAQNRGLLQSDRRIAPMRRAIEFALAPLGALAESICRRAYRCYLQRRASTWTSPDQVRLDDHCLKLHTHSHRRRVLEAFASGSQKLEVRLPNSPIT